MCPFDSVRMIMGDTTRLASTRARPSGSLTIALAGPQLRQAAAERSASAAQSGGKRISAWRQTSSQSNDGVVSVGADPSRRVSYGDLVGGDCSA